MNIPSSHSPPLFEPTSPTVFATERLPLAIYLHACQKLHFVRCEACENGKVRFVFEDLLSNGPDAELEFERGAEVPATALFASQKYLRRAMSAANNRRNGKSNEQQFDNNR